MYRHKRLYQNRTGKRPKKEKDLFLQNNHDYMDALPNEPFSCTPDENSQSQEENFEKNKAMNKYQYFRS